MFKKLVVAGALALTAIGASTASAEAGITNCRYWYGQSWGGFPAGGTSYCDYSSANGLRHRIKLTANNGGVYYGPWVGGGQGSSRDLPYGLRIVGAVTQVG